MYGAENRLNGAPAGGESPPGFLTRFAAFLIDGVLLMVLAYFSGTLMATVTLLVSSNFPGGGLLNEIVGLLLAYYTVTIIVIWLLYFTLGLAVWGSTVGKRMAGLQVVTEDGSPISGGRALARAIVLLVSIAIPIGIIITGIMVAAREDRRGLNDVICGTMVISR